MKRIALLLVLITWLLVGCAGVGTVKTLQPKPSPTPTTVAPTQTMPTPTATNPPPVTAPTPPVFHTDYPKLGSSKLLWEAFFGTPTLISMNDLRWPKKDDFIADTNSGDVIVSILFTNPGSVQWTATDEVNITQEFQPPDSTIVGHDGAVVYLHSTTLAQEAPASNGNFSVKYGVDRFTMIAGPPQPIGK